MSLYGIDGLERSCIRPGLWLVESHHVLRLQTRSKTQANPSGVRWVILRSAETPPNQTYAIDGRAHPTFRDALGALYDHLGERGCDCP